MNPRVRLMRHLSAFASSSLGVIYLYNHVHRLDAFKAKLELKINDNTAKVPDKINNLVSEVMTDMKIQKEDKIRIKPFITKTTDTVHLGSLDSKTGPYLGIPFYFSLEGVEDAAFTVWIDEVRIPQSAPETQLLKQSVILSDNAKKFAIARELYALIFSKAAVKATLPLVVILNFNLCSFLLQKFGKTPNRQSVKTHAFLLFSVIPLYITFWNLIAYYADAEADLLACNLGKEYVQGGIEYYEKMLEKNKGVKKLNKKSPFRDDGDFEFSFIVKPQMPIKNRLVYLNDIISEKQKNPSPWVYVFL